MSAESREYRENMELLKLIEKDAELLALYRELLENPRYDGQVVTAQELVACALADQAQELQMGY